MKKRTPAQLTTLWEKQSSPVPTFQWDLLTCKKEMSHFDKLKVLWNLADEYAATGKRHDCYKVERWAKGMGDVLITRETSLWKQYQKALKDGDERAVESIENAHDETIAMMQLFDSALDLDIQESKVS